MVCVHLLDQAVLLLSTHVLSALYQISQITMYARKVRRSFSPSQMPRPLA